MLNYTISGNYRTNKTATLFIINNDISLNYCLFRDDELLDSSTARFADNSTPKLFASAISDAIEDPQSANERAVRALQAFKPRSTPDVVVPKMISIFRRLQ